MDGIIAFMYAAFRSWKYWSPQHMNWTKRRERSDQIFLVLFYFPTGAANTEREEREGECTFQMWHKNWDLTSSLESPVHHHGLFLYSVFLASESPVCKKMGMFANIYYHICVTPYDIGSFYSVFLFFLYTLLFICHNVVYYCGSNVWCFFTLSLYANR